MHEAVLGKVVRKIKIAAQLSQEISHMRLVPPYQFPERSRVLLRGSPGDKLVIVCACGIQGRLRFTAPC